MRTMCSRLVAGGCQAGEWSGIRTAMACAVTAILVFTRLRNCTDLDPKPSYWIVLRCMGSLCDVNASESRFDVARQRTATTVFAFTGLRLHSYLDPEPERWVILKRIGSSCDVNASKNRFPIARQRTVTTVFAFTRRQIDSYPDRGPAHWVILKHFEACATSMPRQTAPKELPESIHTLLLSAVNVKMKLTRADDPATSARWQTQCHPTTIAADSTIARLATISISLPLVLELVPPFLYQTIDPHLSSTTISHLPAFTDQQRLLNTSGTQRSTAPEAQLLRLLLRQASTSFLLHLLPVRKRQALLHALGRRLP